MYKGKRIAAFMTGAVVSMSAGIASAVPLIDYTATVATLTSDLGTTIIAAVGVGVLILGARLGWRFFKAFCK